MALVGKGVSVEGIDEFRQVLMTLMEVLHPKLEFSMISLGRDANDMAKHLCPKDTGALEASIKNTLTKSNPFEIEVVIGAGDSSISRGAGSFKVGKDGSLVSEKPTSEYASIVEENYPYMFPVSEWLKKNGPTKIKYVLEQVI